MSVLTPKLFFLVSVHHSLVHLKFISAVWGFSYRRRLVASKEKNCHVPPCREEFRSDGRSAEGGEEANVWMCLQSSEWAHVKGRSRFGRGAGVGGDGGEGGGGGIR